MYFRKILLNVYFDKVLFWKLYGIKYKEGGKFNNVRKYNLGSTITNVTSNADWFTDMYSHQSMQDWLNKIDATNYETFNNFQTSWKQNLIKSGYTTTLYCS